MSTHSFPKSSHPPVSSPSREWYKICPVVWLLFVQGYYEKSNKDSTGLGYFMVCVPRTAHWLILTGTQADRFRLPSFCVTRQPSCRTEPHLERVIIPNHCLFSCLVNEFSCCSVTRLIKSALQFLCLLVPPSFQAIRCYLKLVSWISLSLPLSLSAYGGRSYIFDLLSFILYLFIYHQWFTLGSFSWKKNAISTGKPELGFCSIKENTQTEYYKFNVI